MKRVEFFFDLSSPYSYLASTQLEALAARTGAEIVWRPMVLGAVFQAIGSHMPASIAPKRRWMGRDLARWAAHYRVPFHMNAAFPLNTIKAMRLVLLDASRAEAVARAAFAAMWVDNRNITDESELRAIAERAGLDPARALLAIEEPAIKEQLKANTDEAIARGVFGAPAFFVGDELFWGNDRLHFVEQALAATSRPA
jgi:2-hydroxychromene-2-carboxylate isomerase